MTEVDVVVIGGGIQGLVILDVLVERGYSCALVTEGDLGAGQTLHSHGFLNTGFGMMGPELPTAASEIVHPSLRRRAVELSQNWVLIPPPEAPMFAHWAAWPRDLPAAELRVGFAPQFRELARKLPDASVAKRQLVEALSAGREERVIRASVVGFRGQARVDGVLLRRGGAATEGLRAGAVVVAAGCGSKRLLRELAGSTPQIQRIKHRPVHMLCLRAPRGALPANSVMAMPLALMVAAQEDSKSVTWYVTPIEMEGPSFDGIPNNAAAAAVPETLGLATAALLTLSPGLSEVEGLRAGAYAGYRQAIDDTPVARMCGLLEGTSNVIAALPSGLLGAWLNAARVLELLRNLRDPSGVQPPLPGGGEGVRVGNVVEDRPGFAWSSWADLLRAS